MASVSSLDKDLRALRLDKYTPARAGEVRKWIEGVLGEQISSDLLEALRDGSILCRLANLALGPNSVRYKESSMPFVQMENISHFLRVCQAPPLSLPAHDIFLTVDLYESKDPSQVLQCIEAFSRKASALHPDRIPTAIGGKKSLGVSPQHSGYKASTSFSPPHARGGSVSSLGGTPESGRQSPTKGTSSAAPAWNYAQYGWMGGASQGNQGVSFGGRRQITTPAPHVPSLAEKERRRRETEAEAEKERQESDAAERRRIIENEAREKDNLARRERERVEEEARQREEERIQVQAEKQRWEEEERKWREEEDQRVKEEKIAEARQDTDRQRRRANSDARLQGQLLSQYQAEQEQVSAEKTRIAELEKQLAEAKAREQQYENERQRIPQQIDTPSSPVRASVPTLAHKTDFNSDDQAWEDAERDYFRKQRDQNQPQISTPPRPLPIPQASTPLSARPLPVPTAKAEETTPSRPLPSISSYKTTTPQQNQHQQQTPNRTETYLANHPAPAAPSPISNIPAEAAFNSTAESDAEAQRRIASQKATKAGGWASKSLLEREMERERERQREWEDAQKETQTAAAQGLVDPNAGSGPGQTWDVHSYGYTGGDNMNRGSSGVYAGRRQILGPRPLEKK